MTTEYKTATWAQMRDGSWGIRVPGETKEGEIVKTQTRGGKVSYESVGKIVFSGAYNGQAYTLASLGPKPEVKKPAKPRGSRKPKVEHIDVDAAVETYSKELAQEAELERLRPSSDDDLPY